MKNAIRLFKIKRQRQLSKMGKSKVQARLALSSGMIK